jgi:type VI protein secretion system component Hcp
MKKNLLVLSALSLLCIFAFTKPGQPVIGHVKIRAQKMGQLAGSGNAPAYEINITSFSAIDPDPGSHKQGYIVFKKPLDNTSGELQQCLNKNEVLSSVLFELFKNDAKKQMVYETIELSNAIITQINQNAPNEAITLRYEKIQVRNL